jgi:DNA polymerase-3 subunit delta'
MNQEYSKQWDFLATALNNERMPQATLCVTSLDKAFADFMKRLIQMVFCKEEHKPCFECMDCLMAARKEHPDLTFIKPEKSGGPIKIDQIRALQHDFYKTPQRAKYRFVVIQSVERMNAFAANSLLKILEEPPKHTLFFLIAQQLSTVLPTVLSRCQLMRFTASEHLSKKNLLQLAQGYSEDSEQLFLMNQAESILDELLAVIEKRKHPCALANQWSQWDLPTLLWFLYLVYAQVQIILIQGSLTTGPAVHQLHRLAALLNPRMIFVQIDKINAAQRKLAHNININQTLVLEDLLLGI